MADICSGFLIQRLHEWGVTRIYGYPGEGINGILGALDRASDKMDFIQADPRLIVLVLNNRDLNHVTWKQRVMSGDPNS
jgi:thiamine pyrophosphate-dependent acetolactate synthase large subunit-like protein